MVFRRKPDLPPDLHAAWWSFLDCAEVIEGGRRVLLGVLPTGRVEPAPIALGTDALRRAIADARAWMPRWRLDELVEDWGDCLAALDESEAALAEVDQVAGATRELEELLESVQDVIEPLDAFADAEREFRRRWRLPRERSA
jgi:predicted pyridoxine 5'-phosphate oxidase superfamily flavin-nucleotide-binding protein